MTTSEGIAQLPKIYADRIFENKWYIEGRAHASITKAIGWTTGNYCYQLHYLLKNYSRDSKNEEM